MSPGRLGPFILGKVFLRNSDTVAESKTTKAPLSYQVADDPHRYAPMVCHVLDRKRAVGS